MKKIKIKNGLDIPISGKPEELIRPIDKQKIYKIHPFEIRGLKPKLLVKEGEQVKIGTPLIENKLFDKVKFVSPGSGIIKSIKYGPRRVINEITIENSDIRDEYVEFNSYNENEISNLSCDEVKKFLLDSGAWTYIRQRPFSKLVNPDIKPKSIFISGFNSSPLSPNIDFVLNNENFGFQAGVNALSKLTEGKVHLSIHKNTKTDFSSFKNIVLTKFSGPHPSGNIGIQIHHIDPLNLGEIVWYIDIQDICSIGNTILNGKIHTTKYITVVGSEIGKPCYIKTRRCATLGSIIKNNQIKNKNSRIISGDILTGKTSSVEKGLGYYDQSVAVIAESGQRQFLGWISPGTNKYSSSFTFLSKIFSKKEYAFNTNVNGSYRAIIPFGYWESVLPMEIIPNYLVRSILAKDIEEMEKLGIYECDEEDFALCTFVCQSKFPVHKIIREGLDLIESES